MSKVIFRAHVDRNMVVREKHSRHFWPLDRKDALSRHEIVQIEIRDFARVFESVEIKMEETQSASGFQGRVLVDERETGAYDRYSYT